MKKMIAIERKAILTILLILMFVGVFYNYLIVINSSNKLLEVEDGVLDLTKQDFETGELYRLIGDWDLNVAKDSSHSLYSIKVINEEQKAFGIMFKDFAPEYRVWVNGRLLSVTGDEGARKLEYNHEIVDIGHELYMKKNGLYELKIVVEILNSEILRPKFATLVFSDLKTLGKSENIMIAFNLFAIGTYSTLFLFSFSLYYYGRREIYLLFFSMTNMVSFIKALSNTLTIFVADFNDINYIIFKKIDYMTGMINTLLILLLYNQFYTGFLNKKILKGIVILNLGMILGNIFLEYNWAFKIAKIYYLFICVAMFIFCGYLNFRAIMSRKKNACVLFLGLVIYMAGVYFAIMIYIGLIPRGDIGFYANPSQYGSVVFFSLFAFVIAENYAKIFKEKEQISLELSKTNENLEKIIGEKTADLRIVNEQLKIQAETDGLTGLYNHNKIIRILKSEMKHSILENQKLSVLMIDVDYFSEVNNKYGHLKGDQILKWLSNNLNQSCRHMGFIGRYGGEEFLVILPETGEDEAANIAECLRRKIETIYPPGLAHHITISAGVATRDCDETMQTLIGRADEHLYEAKELGRNQISF